MRWTYEELMEEINDIQDAYIYGTIDWGEKIRLENKVFLEAGWTWDEMMTEIKTRYSQELDDADNLMNAGEEREEKKDEIHSIASG